MYWDSDLECQPWSTTLDWQAAQLPDYIRQLQENSPLYTERLAGVEAADVTSIESLAELPTTEKDDLREGRAAADPQQILGLQQTAATADIIQVINSSGTTGGPVYFGLTAADLQAWRHSIAAMFFTAGVRQESVTALSTAMPMVAGGSPYAEGIREIGALLAWIGGQTTARMAAAMEHLSIDTLVGTASFSTFFAEKVTELLGKEAASLPVHTVIAGGEPGMGQPDIRARAQESWGAERISDIMGLGDVLPGMWAECEAGTGMHFTAGRHVLVELIDHTTGTSLPWAEGVEGEPVYTTFSREATPVLRFRSHDHVVVTGMDCACGRRTPQIRCIGRTDDMLIYKGMNVFPSSIRDVVLTEAGNLVDDVIRIRKTYDTQVRFDDAIPVELQGLFPLPTDQQTDLVSRIEERARQELRVRVSVTLHAYGTFERGMYKNSLTYVAPAPPATPSRTDRG